MSKRELVGLGSSSVGVVRSCELLNISRSSYYADEDRKLSGRKKRDALLAAQIKGIFSEYRGRYGAPRIKEEINKGTNATSQKRVARLMRENGLVGRQRRRSRPQSKHYIPYHVAPNLLQQNFSAPAINCVWVGDITYIQTKQGWMYLAIVLDVFSRKIVGWSIQPTLCSQLAISALQMAITLRKPNTQLIHHTDRGSQYSSSAYRALLQQHGIRQSMSRKGNCYDNAMAESFFASFKAECVNSFVFESNNHAALETADYIDNFYNQRRIHSSLNYHSPVQFEINHLQSNKELV